MTSKQQLLELGELIANQLDYRNEWDRQVVQTGLSLYRLGTVFNVEWQSDHDLQGKVIDGQAVEAVSIDTQFLHISKCTCEESFCRHFVATFLAAYSQHWPIGDWLQAWKNRNRPPLPSFVLRSPYGEAMTSETFADWLAHFEQQFNTARKPDVNQTLRIVAHQLTPKIRATAPADEALASWYMYSWHLFIYVKLSPDARKAVGFPYMLYYMEQQFETLLETLWAADRLPQAAITHERRYLFRDLLDFARQLVSIPLYSVVGSFAAYIALIKPFQSHRAFLTRELTRLDEIDAIVPTVAAITLRAFIGETWHLFTLHERFEPIPFALTDPIIRWVLTTDQAFIDRFLTYYTNHCQGKEAIEPLIKRLYLHYKESGQSAWFERLCEAHPALAGHPYRLFLYESQRYEQLAEYLLYLGVRVVELDASERQAMEKHDPRLLFPFYHSDILWEIEERKRDHYIEAVKLLKKLKTLYKKAKQPERFETYLALLIERYKRLRSFMTLLREKKLL